MEATALGGIIREEGTLRQGLEWHSWPCRPVGRNIQCPLRQGHHALTHVLLTTRRQIRRDRSRGPSLGRGGEGGDRVVHSAAPVSQSHPGEL